MAIEIDRGWSQFHQSMTENTGEQIDINPETINEAGADTSPELTPGMKEAANLFGMAMGKILEEVSRKPTPEQVDAFALESTRNIKRTVLNGETDQYFNIVRTFMSRLGEEITESSTNNASLRLGQAMIQQKIIKEQESLGMRKNYKK